MPPLDDNRAQVVGLTNGRCSLLPETIGYFYKFMTFNEK